MTLHNRRRWSARIVVRYAVLQLPEMALLIVILMLVRQWINLPAWLSWGLVTVWIVKDIVLFPFVWHAYDWNRSEDTNPMVGRRGVAVERLDPSGYVQVHGELWRSEVIEPGPPIEKGKHVRIRGMRGLTLLVEPDSEENEKQFTKDAKQQRRRAEEDAKILRHRNV